MCEILLMANAGAWNGLYKVSGRELLVEDHGMAFLARSGRGDGALGKGSQKEAIRSEESGGV